MYGAKLSLVHSRSTEQQSCLAAPITGRIIAQVTAILVQYGLPRLLTGSIIAHEVMHAWLRYQHVQNLSLDVEEGLCQLMASLWLESQQPAADKVGIYNFKRSMTKSALRFY